MMMSPPSSCTTNCSAVVIGSVSALTPSAAVSGSGVPSGVCLRASQAATASNAMMHGVKCRMASPDRRLALFNSKTAPGGIAETRVNVSFYRYPLPESSRRSTLERSDDLRPPDVHELFREHRPRIHSFARRAVGENRRRRRDHHCDDRQRRRSRGSQVRRRRADDDGRRAEAAGAAHRGAPQDSARQRRRAGYHLRSRSTVAHSAR